MSWDRIRWRSRSRGPANRSSSTTNGWAACWLGSRLGTAVNSPPLHTPAAASRGASPAMLSGPNERGARCRADSGCRADNVTRRRSRRVGADAELEVDHRLPYFAFPSGAKYGLRPRNPRGGVEYRVPNNASQAKRLRQSRMRRLRNRQVRSEIRTRSKKLFAMTSREEAEPALSELYQMLDRATRSNVLKPNTAARQKARASRHVRDLA
ncbi:30S ribosomal protein S20 [Candidatus Palauibacter sp.]|uniref:30S ribosomal protein S20 n=1 Tax=Candidatus Palauibacter sp. TaxID=3101350 RepID=UPI003B022CB3